MKSTFLAAALAAGLALGASAQPSFAHIDWGQGPVQFLMTKEEAATWKNITTDAEAEDFIALFWARRDPTPGTPVNEYRDEFERRVAYANKHFQAGERIAGAMTDRGKTLILYGLPKRIVRSAYEKKPGLIEGGRELQEDQRETAEWVQWIYEDQEQVKEIFGVKRAQLRFVDRFGMNEYKVERGAIDLATAQQRAIARTIISPDLTAAPAAPAAAPAAAAATPTNELTTASLRNAIAELKAKSAPAAGKQSHAVWGEYITADGRTFVPVVLYVPKGSGIAPSDALTFFGLIEDESGKALASFEVPAKLTASKDDAFVDRSLAGLPAGKHRGYFGIAENGTPLTLVATDMPLTGTLDRKATAVSQLILSNHLYPLPEAQKPDEPFSFGGLKVVPKADRTFRSSDELWYFLELRNPGLPDSASTDVVPVTGAPVLAPKVQVKIEVEGVDTAGNRKRMAAPPRESEAVPIKGVAGHYGVGSAIPLSSFKPGEYTFTMKVIDTVKKASYTLTEKFRVVE